MAKVKSIITEGEVTFMTDPEIEFISLVGHAANRQPFKVIKGELKGDNEMAKQAIYNVLVRKGVTPEKLQEIVETHNISIEEKVEDQLDGYDIYKQISDEEVDLESRKMAKLDDDAFVIVADLKEDSEKEGIEKEALDWQTMDKVADSLFSMVDIVLGTIRQPEAEPGSRKEMIHSAITNFTNSTTAVLDTAKAEDVLDAYEVKSEVVKEFMPVQDKEPVPEPVDYESMVSEAKEELRKEFEEKLNDLLEQFQKTKEDLNTNLNEHLEAYQKKEEIEKKFSEVEEEIETLKNTTKSRNSEIDEGTPVAKKSKTEKKNNQFITFV